MTDEEMRAELAHAIQEGGGLYDGLNYMNWVVGDPTVTLDGAFTANELEAIARWMRQSAPENAVRPPSGKP